MKKATATMRERVDPDRACSTCELPPPGETGRELTGPEAVTALQRRLDAIPAVQVVHLPALTKLRVVDLDIRKDNGRFVIVVKFWKQQQPVALRVSTAWLKVLRGRIDRALNE